MAEALKNWFDEAFYADLAAALADHCDGFDERRFVKAAIDGLDGRELKDRLRHTAELCRRFLPGDYRGAVEILKRLAPRYDGEFRGMFCPEFVGLYGTEDAGYSLGALAFFTAFSSSEFAVRPFLARDLDGTLAVMAGWARSENHHLRRLASEGARPRLPWAHRIPALIDTPGLTRPILETLKSDPELYVRKSVANHLNDISKDHPEFMLDCVESWGLDDEKTAWIVKHAARGLLKGGHPRAFSLFGFAASPALSIETFSFDAGQVRPGDGLTVHLDAAARSAEPQKLAIDIKVHYMKKNGRTSPKVFKWRETVLEPDGRISLRRRIEFDDLSTRRHYAGEHGIELMINGQSFATRTFELVL